jgi:hypothetical protein
LSLARVRPNLAAMKWPILAYESALCFSLASAPPLY